MVTIQENLPVFPQVVSSRFLCWLLAIVFGLAGGVILPSARAEELLKIEQFLLINAETNQPVRILHDGETLNLAELPTRELNIRALASSDAVKSVVFQLGDVKRYRHETARPFALAGDKLGNYRSWTPKLGELTIIATPSDAHDTQVGRAKKVTLNVIDESSVATEESLEQLDSDFDYGQMDSSVVRLRLLERDLEVGECVTNIDQRGSRIIFDCEHYLKDVASARLQVQRPDDRDYAISCEFTEGDTKFLSSCPFTEGVDAERKQGNLYVQILGGKQEEVTAFGQVQGQ